jgi:beta-lactamase class A
MSMTLSILGPKRIKRMLPPNTPFAHETGASDTRNGLTAATNDVGIITLPMAVTSPWPFSSATRLAMATSARDIFACWFLPH